MLSYSFEAGNKTYELRLNTKNVIELEKALGVNPLSIFGDGSTIPTVSTMITILHASMKQLNHGITLNDTAEIFDNWLNEGNTITDFIPIILEIYKVSGIIRVEDLDEKN